MRKIRDHRMKEIDVQCCKAFTFCGRILEGADPNGSGAFQWEETLKPDDGCSM